METCSDSIVANFARLSAERSPHSTWKTKRSFGLLAKMEAITTAVCRMKESETQKAMTMGSCFTG